MIDETVEGWESHCPRCARTTTDMGNEGLGIMIIRCQECGYVKQRRLTTTYEN